jgi:hypothetical protein
MVITWATYFNIKNILYSADRLCFGFRMTHKIDINFFPLYNLSRLVVVLVMETQWTFYAVETKFLSIIIVKKKVVLVH